MDPLSIAASVAGLLALAGTIISKGYASIAQAKKNKGDIAAMLNEVTSFSGILAGMKARYSATDGLESMPLHRLVKDHEKVWQESMTDCEKTLEEVNEILDSLASSNVVHRVVKSGSMAQRLERSVSKIERFKGFFALCLQMESSADLEETNRVMGEMLGLLQNLLHGQDSLRRQIEAQEENTRREQIIKWLGHSSEAVQEDVVKGRAAHSSQWLLDRIEFLSWFTSEESANFWLWGTQGSGKTVIVSTVIETIQNQYLEDGDVLLYHYCRFSDSTSLSSERLIGGMITMLLSHLTGDDPNPEALIKVFNRHRSSSYPNLKELQPIFHELCQRHSRTFVIIDGLDEVAERSGILEFLINLPSVGGNFKIFVASRPEFDLEKTFESYLTVAITQADVQGDIESYVLQQFDKLQVGDDEETDQYAIVSELVQRAQGMFLWAVCQIDHLSRIRTAITTDVLTALPRGLESTFEEALVRLEEEDRLLALQILRVIMFSKRPLDLLEVVEAAAVDSKVKNLKQLRKSTLRRHSDVFELCGSLIRQSRSTGKISLAHYSVQEFLSRQFLQNGRQNQFFLPETESLQKQLEVCILYLSLDDFASETFQETFRLAKDNSYLDSDLQIFAKTPFLDYAASYWTSHLRGLGSENVELAWPLLDIFFFGRKNSFESWILVSQYTYGDYRFPNGSHPIHIAVLYGLESLVLKLLSVDTHYVSLQTSDGRTPLHIALENEHDEIADLLLKRGASTTVTDKKDRTPLHVAIESGNEFAVALLVTDGANINAIQSNGRTPISVAIENKWDQLASFLSQLADAKVLLPDGRSLLHLAAQSGSLKWATTLLDCHEELLIDATDENEWTPLHYAVDRGHTEIALKLISCKCLIRVFDRNGWTPLHAAIRRRNLELASAILKAEWPRGGRRRGHTRPESGRPSPGPAPLGGESASTRRRTDYERSERPRRRMSGKYGSSFDLEPDRSGLDSDTSTRGFEEPRWPRKSSPLYLAVSDSYVDGVKLLSKYLLKLGMDDKDTMECLKKAIQLVNADITLVLVDTIDKRRLREMIPQIASIPSEAIIEWVKMKFTVDEVYSKLIPSIMKTDEDRVIQILQIWPDADESMINRALRFCASQKDRQKLAKVFIDNNISASKVFTEQGEYSLLHSALEMYDAQFAKFCIEKGANVDTENGQGETPLLVVAGLKLLGQEQVWLGFVHQLVSYGCNVQALDKRDRGVCHKAAAAGNTKLLDWALHTVKLQADLRDKHSRTPLLLAVESGSLATIRQLLEYFATTDEDDNYAGPERVINAMEYANKRSTSLLRAMVDREERNINIVMSLVEADEKAFKRLSPTRQNDLSNLRTSSYIEAFCWTIECDFLSGFTFLLPKISKSALFSWMTIDGDNVLHSAAGVVNNEYLKTLLQRLKDHNDADSIIRIANAKGKTPLDIAVEKSSTEKVAILLHFGAKSTPLHVEVAKRKGNKELEELLLRHNESATPEEQHSNWI